MSQHVSVICVHPLYLCAYRRCRQLTVLHSVNRPGSELATAPPSTVRYWHVSPLLVVAVAPSS
jgi:hypothetical protein